MFIHLPQGSFHQGSEDTHMPCAAPHHGSVALPRAQDPISVHQVDQSLPQQCLSRAGVQLLTALPCPGMGPAELGPPMSPPGGPVSAHPHPQGGACCLELGLPQLPSGLLCSWLGWWDRP